MRNVMLVMVTGVLTGCDLSGIGELFEGRPNLLVDPAVVPVGISELEVTDDTFRLDFRAVEDVEDIGDFVVREWSSNDERLFVEVDVFDDAFGTQQLLIRLDDEDVIEAPFTVR